MLKKDEYWYIEVQVLPGDRLSREVARIYRVDKTGDVGFMLVEDENIYWRSQVEWFEPIRKLVTFMGDENE